MKDFRVSDAVYLCEECGEEMKVLSTEEDDFSTGVYIDLECRGCGPQGRAWIDLEGTIE